MGIYTPPGESDATLVVGPLDDGSVCLWDIGGARGRKGSIVARSRSGLISSDPPHTSKPQKLINTGVTECVSVDSARKKAYFAVQDGMFLFLLCYSIRHSPIYYSQDFMTLLGKAPSHIMMLSRRPNFCFF